MKTKSQPKQTKASNPARQIAVGDVVIMKSGGPLMTVGEIKDGKAFCHWMSGQVGLAMGGCHSAEHFPIVLLRPVDNLANNETGVFSVLFPNLR